MILLCTADPWSCYVLPELFPSDPVMLRKNGKDRKRIETESKTYETVVVVRNAERAGDDPGPGQMVF